VLTDVLQAPPARAVQFRYELNMAYDYRYLEILRAYRSDYDRLPVGNRDIDEKKPGHLRLG
jgi:hypothetical protein